MDRHEIDYLRLSAENFGPIATADVELRPLTVFVGPSGSGKSYLAKLIYAPHRYFSLHLAFRNRRWKAPTRFYEIWREIPEQRRLEVVEWIEEQLAAEPSVIDIPCPPEVVPLAREAVREWTLGSGSTWSCSGSSASRRSSD